MVFAKGAGEKAMYQLRKELKESPEQSTSPGRWSPPQAWYHAVAHFILIGRDIPAVVMLDPARLIGGGGTRGQILVGRGMAVCQGQIVARQSA